MNSVNIIGRIGKEIELKYLASGSAVASFSIAVDQSYVKDGQKVEKTSWIDISAFAKTAENINQYFHKGSMIGVSGELEQQTWQAQDGSNRSKIIVKLQKFTFIDKKDNTQQNQNQNYQQPTQQQYQQPNQGNNAPVQYQQQQQNGSYQPAQQPNGYNNNSQNR